ncbi:MAG: hypothetical protein V4664_00680 [Patescibacteria group bacterium]
MKERELVVGIRHFEDINVLRKFGLNAGLKEGQEDLAYESAKSLIELAEDKGATYIEMFSSDQKRTCETAILINEAVQELKPNFSEVNIDRRLSDLNQGELNLGPEYKDGERFEPLKEAWDCFWEETFNNGDLLYRFGDSKSMDGARKYDKLEGKFLKLGECYAQMAERYYDFLCSLLNQEASAPSSRLVTIVGHSITFGIMHELSLIAKDYNYPYTKPIDFGELPKLTWEYFDKLKSGVLSKNPGYGEIAVFDISYLKDNAFIEQLSVERDALRSLMFQSNVQS